MFFLFGWRFNFWRVPSKYSGRGALIIISFPWYNFGKVNCRACKWRGMSPLCHGLIFPFALGSALSCTPLIWRSWSKRRGNTFEKIHDKAVKWWNKAPSHLILKTVFVLIFFNYTCRLKKLFMFFNVLEIPHHMAWGPSMIHVLLVANIIF